MIKTLVNGDSSRALALNDRGLLYGDGLFETIAVVRGQTLDLDRHLRRLYNGCQRLAITPPATVQLRAELDRVCAGVERAVLKIIVTRGVGGRGYRPAGQGAPTRILMLDAWPELPRRHRELGIAITCCQTRLARNPELAGLKHLNRLEQVLARGEWAQEYEEGLLLDSEGNVIEGTMSNVFAVREDALYTPELNYAGVAGIMRERVIECAVNAGIRTCIRSLKLHEIATASALFCCNSLIGIWPVRRLDGRAFDRHPLVQKLIGLLNLE